MKSYGTQTYECPRCKSVTMDIEYESHNESQTGEREQDRKFVNRIEEYGECLLAKEFEGVIPADRINDCPVISTIFKDRNRS